MSIRSLALFMLANTTVVIDVNGQVRELLPGEVPGPGEVIVILGQGATAFNGIEVNVVDQSGVLSEVNLDSEIATIYEHIEQGKDPTLNKDLATAAGTQDGSSPTQLGEINRVDTETQAETWFETRDLESQGLSETQSVILLDLVQQSLLMQIDDSEGDSERYEDRGQPIVPNEFSGANDGSGHAVDLETNGEENLEDLVFLLTTVNGTEPSSDLIDQFVREQHDIYHSYADQQIQGDLLTGLIEESTLNALLLRDAQPDGYQADSATERGVLDVVDLLDDPSDSLSITLVEGGDHIHIVEAPLSRISETHHEMSEKELGYTEGVSASEVSIGLTELMMRSIE